MSITLEQAERIIAAGKRKANEMGIPMTIAVCDPGGNQVALGRMDNAILASLDYAIGKAYTAVAMKMNTADLVPYVQPGQPLYGLQVGHQPRPLVVLAGGLPLEVNGQLVGGVGVSGGLPDQDGQVAAAAVEGLKL
jgi:cob(I)alamin adenosyltransferase